MVPRDDQNPETRLALKVIPGARRSGIDGWLGDALKVRVRAAPERGKANAAVERLLAETLGLSTDAVSIVAGTISPWKTIEIRGLSRDAVREKLGLDEPALG